MLELNPANYKKINLVKIIEKLSDFQPWNIEDMPSAEDHLLEGVRRHVEANSIKEFGRKEAEDINNLTKEYERPRVNRIGQKVWTRNINPITIKGELPKGFGQTTRDDQQISPKHSDTTIVLFASLTRSFKFNSLYNKGLKNTTVEQFYRKAGQVSRYTINNQPYLVVTVPPNQPGETTVSCEQIFRPLATTAHQLEETEKNIHIIFDGDLIWLYFKLEPKQALIAITLALAHVRYLLKSVEVQVSTQLTKILTKEAPCMLSKQLPIIVNKKRTFNIRIPLDDTGRAVNIEETVLKANNIDMTATNNLIEFNEGATRYH